MNPALKILYMKTSCLVLIFMLLAVNAFMNYGIMVFADDIIEPYEYEIEFDNGTIFYMYVGDDSLQSGLYDNTVAFSNIYLLETPAYFYKNDLVFSENGLYFAHFPWTSYDRSIKQGGVAVEFYSSGSKTKQFLLNEVILDLSRLEPSVSHIVWENESKRAFDKDANFLTVTALDGTITGFDITTGELNFRDPGTGFPCSYCGGSSWGKYWCRHNGYLGWKIIGIVAGVVVLLLATIVLIYKKKERIRKIKRHKKLHKKN